MVYTNIESAEVDISKIDWHVFPKVLVVTEIKAVTIKFVKPQ